MASSPSPAWQIHRMPIHRQRVFDELCAQVDPETSLSLEDQKKWAVANSEAFSRYVEVAIKSVKEIVALSPNFGQSWKHRMCQRKPEDHSSIGCSFAHSLVAQRAVRSWQGGLYKTRLCENVDGCDYHREGNCCFLHPKDFCRRNGNWVIYEESGNPVLDLALAQEEERRTEWENAQRQVESIAAEYRKVTSWAAYYQGGALAACREGRQFHAPPHQEAASNWAQKAMRVAALYQQAWLSMVRRKDEWRKASEKVVDIQLTITAIQVANKVLS